MKEYIERGELESILHNRYQVLAAKTPAFRHADTAALKEY